VGGDGVGGEWFGWWGFGCVSLFVGCLGGGGGGGMLGPIQ